MLFFFNDTATTEIYTLSLHDALPISARVPGGGGRGERTSAGAPVGDSYRNATTTHAVFRCLVIASIDRKSTRLNSSHLVISYAVFCLKKKTLIRCPRARVRRRSCPTS